MKGFIVNSFEELKENLAKLEEENKEEIQIIVLEE